MSEKLKVLFVRPTLAYSGADRVTINILRDFDRERFVCDLALMKKEGEFMSDIPGDVQVFETGSSVAPLMFFPLIKIIKSGKYDIIYSTSGGTNAPAILATIFSGRKAIKVISERNIMLPPGKSFVKQKFGHLMKKLTYPYADFVTTVSKSLKEEILKETRVKKEKVKFVYNPIINESLLHQREERLDVPLFHGKEPVILAVGRFVYQKDYTTMFKAFALVNEKIPAHLYILGKGPMEEEFRELASDMNLKDRIHFGGFDKNPFRYMKYCSTFVLSSKHEGMPGVLIQALACGAPCVSTDCPTGPNEIIEDNENGFLVPVEDHQAIARRILEILTDRDVEQRFRRNGPDSVLKFHSNAAIESYFKFLS